MGQYEELGPIKQSTIVVTPTLAYSYWALTMYQVLVIFQGLFYVSFQSNHMS